MEKCFYPDNDIYLALLKIHWTPIGPGLLSPALLLFSRAIRCPNDKVNQTTIIFDYNDEHYAALIERQLNADKSKDTH